MRSYSDLSGFFLWLLLVSCAALIAGAFSPVYYPEWYGQLVKPAWNPPDGIFGPVWTLLYVLMTFSVWRIWRKGGWNEQGWALSLFIIQLIFNAAWMGIFFGLQAIGIAFLEIVFLFVLIALTIFYFYRIDKLSAYLLFPYLIWVGYATALTYYIWRHNSSPIL